MAADGELPKGKIKARLQKISNERDRIEDRLGDSTEDLRAGVEVIDGALRTLERPNGLYESMGGQGRRALNQAIFTKLYIYGTEVVDDGLKAPFADLVEVHRAGTLVEVERQQRPVQSARGRWAITPHRPLSDRASALAGALADESWSKDVLVELGRIELPSAKRLTTALRPFPRSSRTAGSLPGQVGSRPPPRLSETSVFFRTVSGLSRRQPRLLLPGCRGQAPCAIAGHDVSLR